MDTARLVSSRAKGIDASGIRRVFELGAKLKDPINLSIGQPDFPVPAGIKRAAIEAIEQDRNGYTLTQGIPELRARIASHLEGDLGWTGLESPDSGLGVCVTSGTSGALLLAMLAVLDPGDELIIPDPYFVMYPHLATMTGAKAVRCDTYPDFRMTAERVEPLITEKTKVLLVNSPSNPAGIVLSREACRDLLEMCRAKNVLLISDEIYDEFTYRDARTDTGIGSGLSVCPSPGRFEGAASDVLLVRGFGKTYGITGWRMGYVAGPKAVVDQIAKLQQYTFVCAPSMAQWGSLAAFDADITGHVDDYQKRRDLVLAKLGPHTEVQTPGGAFYAFPQVPERLGLSASAFIERALEKSVLVIPGKVFSERDTHFRLSYATKMQNLERGLDALAALMR
ncbi:MAG: aminotransferase class I/II-fold pyridoxal phosphate-dependent enzyme [Phycisphaerales bacterium]|nr:MAG: aminotransferase class I/II-fold pyridoxal phosphate-dependent enzyme [Phycisphaerales bacterium]